MSDQTGNKKCCNVTIDQMIEHMTADLHASDGQYMQLGFTPPATTNEQTHAWNSPPGNNIYSAQYAMNRNRMNYNTQMDQGNFQRQPPGFNNYVPNMPNTVYISDPTTQLPPNQIDQRPDLIPIIPDLRGAGYIVYNHQSGNPTFMQSNPQNLSNMYVPPSYQDSHDYGMFLENSMLHHQQELLHQQNNQLSKSPQTSSQNRTPLIENLVGNWAAPNTSGTYTPFGNVNHDAINISNLEINENDLSGIPLRNTTNRPVKKPRMIAEVKPMRPSYSDVLAKSAPINSPLSKSIKNELGSSKENINKTKTSVSKKSTPSKIVQSKNSAAHVNPPGRQYQTEDEKNNISPQHRSEKGININNMWTTIGNEDSSVNSDGDNERDTRSVKKDKQERKTDSKKYGNGDGGKSSGTHSKFNINQTGLNFDWDEEDTSEDSNVKNPEKVFTKSVKKTKDFKVITGKSNDRNSYGVVDKPPTAGRRGHRRRRENTHSTIGFVYRYIKQYLHRWSSFVLCIIVWLYHLISDVCTLSVHLTKDLCSTSWSTIKLQTSNVSKTIIAIFSKVQIFVKAIRYIDETWGNKWWAFWNRGKESKIKNDPSTWHNRSGLEVNIAMPSTGEEAMKRLLACKGKDPYSILGVTPDCTDDDIKRYYKRQAFLVHPDKNPQPGAEEAFKILVHAFDIIGEPERRQSYDRGVAESHQVEQAWSELNDLLSQLHQKMEYAANTIRCTNCTKRHRRIHVDRPCYAARMCAQCKIHHSAKEGDIWAESQCFGFLWYYFACMDGAVYDITEWASCQRANLRHLRPNTHQVQYRIVLGKQANGQSSSVNNNFNHKHRGSKVEREPDLEEFLNNLNLYQKTGGRSSGTPGTTPSTQETTGNRTDSSRNRKKHKRKK